MLNIDSALRATMENLKKYEKETIEAERVLDRQFHPAIIKYLEASMSGHHVRSWEITSKKLSVLKKKINIRTEEDPKRVIAWAIAQRVREAREMQGLRQADLAKMTGIARPNIVRIEQGYHVPSLTTLKKIADALRININSLTAQPEVTAEDRLEFTRMAESGMAEWRSQLEEDEKD